MWLLVCWTQSPFTLKHLQIDFNCTPKYPPELLCYMRYQSKATWFIDSSLLSDHDRKSLSPPCHPNPRGHIISLYPGSASVSCLSNLILTGLAAIPLVRLHNSLNMEWIEEYLESTGYPKWSKSLRNFKKMFTSSASLSEQLEWIKVDRQDELQLEALVQREIYLKEEIAAWRAKAQVLKTGIEPPAKIKKWEKELKQVDKLYWLYAGMRYRHQFEKPHGPAIRDYEIWRREHKDVDERIRCAARGGCCAEKCGCCSRPRNTERNLHKYMHCAMLYSGSGVL